MLALPKAPFALTGGLEAGGQLLMMLGAAQLPGALLPLLMQTSLLWSLGFSALLLGMRWVRLWGPRGGLLPLARTQPGPGQQRAHFGPAPCIQPSPPRRAPAPSRDGHY